MNTVAIADVEGYVRPEFVFKSLSESLGTDGLALNYYECAPGETIGHCYHRHHDQEEVFYVHSGTATFETSMAPDGSDPEEVRVGAGELVRFAPGEWQQGRNASEERLTVLALGAPREQGPTDLMRDCPSCGERTPAVVEETADSAVFYCEACGTETGRFD